MTQLQCMTCLNDDQAPALAQLTKRIGWTELRALASSDEEAELMREGIGSSARLWRRLVSHRARSQRFYGRQNRNLE